MGRLPALLVVLLTSACAGGDESVTMTVTRTVTISTTEATPTTTPPRLPFPLPADGTLPVDGFNAYAESVDEPWERDLAALTDAFVEAGAREATQRSFQATSSGEGGASASVSLTLGGLLDDSVHSQRYDLTLSRRQDGTWRLVSASWAQRCQEGRGHQAFTPALCL